MAEKLDAWRNAHPEAAEWMVQDVIRGYLRPGWDWSDNWPEARQMEWLAVRLLEQFKQFGQIQALSLHEVYQALYYHDEPRSDQLIRVAKKHRLISQISGRFYITTAGLVYLEKWNEIQHWSVVQELNQRSDDERDLAATRDMIVVLRVLDQLSRDKPMTEGQLTAEVARRFDGNIAWAQRAVATISSGGFVERVPFGPMLWNIGYKLTDRGRGLARGDKTLLQGQFDAKWVRRIELIQAQQSGGQIIA